MPDPIRLGEPRLCIDCHMSMRVGTLVFMRPDGRVEHARAATCLRRMRQRRDREALLSADGPTDDSAPSGEV